MMLPRRKKTTRTKERFREREKKYGGRTPLRQLVKRMPPHSAPKQSSEMRKKKRQSKRAMTQGMKAVTTTQLIAAIQTVKQTQKFDLISFVISGQITTQGILSLQ